MRKILLLSAVLVFLAAFSCPNGVAQGTLRRSTGSARLKCPTLDLGFCHEVNTPTEYAPKYVGHDEPAINFYSHVPGSGNSAVYLLTLPLDPRNRRFRTAGAHSISNSIPRSGLE